MVYKLGNDYLIKIYDCLHSNVSLQEKSEKLHISFFFISRLEEIGAAAAKEYSLEKALEKMKSDWKDLNFEMIPYRDTVSSYSWFWFFFSFLAAYCHHD